MSLLPTAPDEPQPFFRALVGVDIEVIVARHKGTSKAARIAYSIASVALTADVGASSATASSSLARPD